MRTRNDNIIEIRKRLGKLTKSQLNDQYFCLLVEDKEKDNFSLKFTDVSLPKYPRNESPWPFINEKIKDALSEGKLNELAILLHFATSSKAREGFSASYNDYDEINQGRIERYVNTKLKMLEEHKFVDQVELFDVKEKSIEKESSLPLDEDLQVNESDKDKKIEKPSGKNKELTTIIPAPLRKTAFVVPKTEDQIKTFLNKIYLNEQKTTDKTLSIDRYQVVYNKQNDRAVLSSVNGQASCVISEKGITFSNNKVSMALAAQAVVAAMNKNAHITIVPSENSTTEEYIQLFNELIKAGKQANEIHGNFEKDSKLEKIHQQLVEKYNKQNNSNLSEHSSSIEMNKKVSGKKYHGSDKDHNTFLNHEHSNNHGSRSVLQMMLDGA
ncbi:hypothetical protein PsalN5692_01070 [Piscirickettsia salmonis]|uniref:hypothetical protein n=1 Tax=Piscirickettsia salmonis TaxID=1238 RepID=UPI002066C951|nr:hypothetical protein PsalN5692_01070 [Piscirickettsia salmonis]